MAKKTRKEREWDVRYKFCDSKPYYTKKRIIRLIRGDCCWGFRIKNLKIRRIR